MIFVVQVPKHLVEGLHKTDDNIIICSNYKNERKMTNIMHVLFEEAQKDESIEEVYVWSKCKKEWNLKNTINEHEMREMFKHRLREREFDRDKDYEKQTVIFIDSLEMLYVEELWDHDERNTVFNQMLQFGKSVGLRFVITVCNPRREFVRTWTNVVTPIIYNVGLFSEAECEVMSSGRHCAITKEPCMFYWDEHVDLEMIEM